MVSAFATQQHVLNMFSNEIERYRPAPRYHFTQSPHAGRLHYENFDWGVTGERWPLPAIPNADNSKKPQTRC